MGFTSERVLRRVLRRRSQKGFLEGGAQNAPLGEYNPLGVRPTKVLGSLAHPVKSRASSANSPLSSQQAEGFGCGLSTYN